MALDYPGNRDRPGCARLPRFHAALWVGNEMAASHRSRAGNPFDVVLSTVPPRDVETFAPVSLTTHEFLFDDRCGRETPAARGIAQGKILAAAQALDAALAAGSSAALVHCSWGQNRSCAICVAWAVLYREWAPDDAIRYAKERCRAERRYQHPRPLHNEVFLSILRSLAPSATGEVVRRPTGLTTWLKKRPREEDEADAPPSPFVSPDKAEAEADAPPSPGLFDEWREKQQREEEEEDAAAAEAFDEWLKKQPREDDDEADDDDAEAQAEVAEAVRLFQAEQDARWRQIAENIERDAARSEAIDYIVGMGFSSGRAEAALDQCGGDRERALDYILRPAAPAAATAPAPAPAAAAPAAAGLQGGTPDNPIQL